MKVWKVLERGLVMLTCLMLVSASAGSGLVTVEASNPHQRSARAHAIEGLILKKMKGTQ